MIACACCTIDPAVGDSNITPAHVVYATGLWRHWRPGCTSNRLRDVLRRDRSDRQQQLWHNGRRWRHWIRNGCRGGSGWIRRIPGRSHDPRAPGQELQALLNQLGVGLGVIMRWKREWRVVCRALAVGIAGGVRWNLLMPPHTRYNCG